MVKSWSGRLLAASSFLLVMLAPARAEEKDVHAPLPKGAGDRGV